MCQKRFLLKKYVAIMLKSHFTVLICIHVLTSTYFKFTLIWERKFVKETYSNSTCKKYICIVPISYQCSPASVSRSASAGCPLKGRALGWTTPGGSGRMGPEWTPHWLVSCASWSCSWGAPPPQGHSPSFLLGVEWPTKIETDRSVLL